MKKKILMALTALILSILPFLISAVIGKYSPYKETNSFQRYVIIWIVISIVISSIILLLFKYFRPSFDTISVGGALLFLLLCPIVGIYGLAAAPDLSVNMLQHPEREHFRYSLLFIALILFGGFILFLFRTNSLKIKKSTRWIVTVILTFAFAEYAWEFTHHYLYPEALKDWVNQGKDIEAFENNYDNFNLVTIGVIGRYFQFASVIWFSIHLYKSQQIKIWSPILNVAFSLLGIVSATIIFITKMNMPKGFEILWLFFIPGIPFFLLYWLGVGLLTDSRKVNKLPEKVIYLQPDSLSV